MSSDHDLNIVLRQSFHKYSTNICVITEDRRQFTYHDIYNYTKEISGFTSSGRLVFCLATNTPGSLAGYLSFLLNGQVPLMLDSGIDNGLLNDLIQIYSPAYIWKPENLESLGVSGLKTGSALNYEMIETDCNRNAKLHPDLALLLTTSGSTGSPKLVKLSYDNILSNAVSISDYLNINSAERPITALPMHYSFGLSIINSHLIKGATFLLTNRSLMEKEFWKLIKNGEATSLSGIPYSFEILKKLRFFKMDLPCLRTITQAGGKLNDDLNREFSEYCIKTDKRFFVMYGQTEATARMSYLPQEYSISKLGSMGVAIPGGEFHLIDDYGQMINEHDIVGELVYKGKNVSMGYAECGSDLSNEDENKGVLITGDLAKKDKDGFYYIVGRKKRFLKLFGNRVNLDETERLLKNIIPECACTGIDDKMFIFITDKNRTKEVRNYISSKTGINSNAFEIHIIKEIPKNSSGKTIYSKLNI